MNVAGEAQGIRGTQANVRRARRLESCVRLARRWLGVAAVAPIVAYSKAISPALPRRCRYEPTCSAYAVEAVRGFGVPRGLVLAVWRVLRCNPFSDGGYDPVDAQRLFTRERHRRT